MERLPVILEVRTYRLKPGTGEEFVRVMREESVPLLEESGIRVVDYGTSLVAEDGHEEAYLIRAFTSLETHREQEDRFYGSDAWRLGPREAIVSRIDSYHTIVFEASEQIAQAFQRQ
ncbi:NIPSNAP protein [Streptosporangium subroseum]|uniref:NIPSNAP protein n=1 Tax=Streptosporangium subroseum TaxID=106412 RepID=A0A239HPH6_9ACTN|nr:NIPSNAP protein [Streptosporangium subroseum]